MTLLFRGKVSVGMDGFRFGIVDPIVNARFSPTLLPRMDSLTAAATGADSLWVPDHLNALVPNSIATPEYLGVAAKLVPNVDAVLEPWTMLGHLAARNGVRRLRLGVCVTDASRRNPAVTAQAAATLHLLTRGRAILGIGVGEREGNQPYGVEWTKPVARFEEAIATIRTLWDSAGELVSRDSPYFPLRNAVFALPPYRGKWPEIWVAAHGPRMLRITGRYADAWVPFVVSRPTDYARGLEAVRAAASDAGRDPMSITPAVQRAVVTGRNRDDVDEALDSVMMKIVGARGTCRSLGTSRRSASTGSRLFRRARFGSPNHGQAERFVIHRESPGFTHERNQFSRDTGRSHRPSSGMARSRPPIPKRYQRQHA